MSEARLRFEVGGGRTFLHEQYVPYPFHITRPFYLDEARPDLATLFLQSSSGGLYRRDRLALDIELGRGAMAHVTSQAGTVVHDARRDASILRVRVRLAAGSFLALTFDPSILLPGADLDSAIEVTSAPDAQGVILDGLLAHDPEGRCTPFARVMTSMLLRTEDGTLLAVDRQEINGDGMGAGMGEHRCLGSGMLFGAACQILDAAELDRELAELGCFSGTSELPNQAGLGVRLLAPDGSAFRAGLDHVFTRAVEGALDLTPAPRRK